MAREFAKRFYNSKAWHIARRICIDRANGLCERCGDIGEIVHHKTYLKPSNIHDVLINATQDNLELLCRACHEKEHQHDRVYFSEDGEIIPPKKNLWG